ncbi:MAG: 16S rRNA processing protein RimM, partial [Zetaproteobacteria bacterium]
SHTRPPEGILEYRKWWIASPDGQAQQALVWRRARVLRKKIVVEAKGISTRTQAEQLKGCRIFVRKADVRVEDGEYLWADLVGMEVADTEGRTLGRVVRVACFGAQDILIVEGRGPTGARGEWMIPFTGEVIEDVNTEARKITIRMLAGLDACFSSKF